MGYTQKIVRLSPQTSLFLSDLDPNLTYFRGRAHLSRTLGLGAYGAATEECGRMWPPELVHVGGPFVTWTVSTEAATLRVCVTPPPKVHDQCGALRHTPLLTGC